jgi:hypothetical protein
LVDFCGSCKEIDEKIRHNSIYLQFRKFTAAHFPGLNAATKLIAAHRAFDLWQPMQIHACRRRVIPAFF